jgi:hypothetical protein
MKKNWNIFINLFEIKGMYMRNFLCIFVLFIVSSCTHETSWDDYYRHVKIKPNTPEYNQELDQWKNPWKYKAYEPIQQKQTKSVKKKSSKAEKQELKRQAAERVCQKKATQTIVIPHQPTATDALAEGFQKYKDLPTKNAYAELDNMTMASIGDGMKTVANDRRQDPQVYTQFDEDLFYLCMSEYGFDLEEQ